ncbi:BSD domain-containing protein 1-like [Cylas formicarius]|uniref:BSD domain-containing protein 1-like n=1 Tax=Cylas formicarius TaxID=197179 RepID=UPI00295840E4|nr:BSD domain-containing protein 1-like [Cylas formicarius]
MEEKTDTWFGSWLKAAKDKSSEVFEFVKKDLEEFSSVVKNEASNVVSSAGTVVEKTLNLESPVSAVGSVKRSFSMFLGQMNTVLNPSPDDSDAEPMLVVENFETVKLNKYQKLLYELQKNPETYLCDPEPHLQKQFDCWLEIIDDQLSDDKIVKQVNSSEVLKQQYAKLVPDIIEHHVFWKRYLFKKALLEDEMARQEMLEKREMLEYHEKSLNKNHQNLTWEQEDFAENVELTEEQQIQLLEEYENETKEKKKLNTKDIKDERFLKKEIVDKVKKSEENKSEKLNDTDSTLSLNTPSSNSSVDDDWERVSDVEK